MLVNTSSCFQVTSACQQSSAIRSPIRHTAYPPSPTHPLVHQPFLLPARMQICRSTHPSLFLPTRPSVQLPESDFANLPTTTPSTTHASRQPAHMLVRRPGSSVRDVSRPPALQFFLKPTRLPPARTPARKITNLSKCMLTHMYEDQSSELPTYNSTYWLAGQLIRPPSHPPTDPSVHPSSDTPIRRPAYLPVYPHTKQHSFWDVRVKTRRKFCQGFNPVWEGFGPGRANPVYSCSLTCPSFYPFTELTSCSSSHHPARSTVRKPSHQTIRLFERHSDCSDHLTSC